MRRPLGRWALLAGLALLGLSCTEAGLYDRRQAPVQADRVALTGRVCTDDAEVGRFPVKVVLVVDRAAGPLFSDYDPAGDRIRRLSDLAQSALSRPGFEVAVVGFAGRATRLAPDDGAFSRNPGELLAGITELSLPQGCLDAGRCRDTADGLRVAGAVIEDDLAATPAGVSVLTRYVVVLVEAGPPRPAAAARACCPAGDRACVEARGDQPSVPCQTDLDLARLADLQGVVADAGAAGLVLHTVQLLAPSDDALNATIAARHARLAFAGGGRALSVPSPAALDFTRLGLFDRDGELAAKRLVVANVNALPSPAGPVPDSDGDGLSDADEIAGGSDPQRADTDGDGLTDHVERLTGFDPRVADAPIACEALRPTADSDLDGLTDCDERTLGTDATLVDTDGDGLPERLELALGTDYLHADDVGDLDGDGVPNGDEIRERTDPRTADPPSRLGEAYRYEVDDEGLEQAPVADPFKFLNGVEVVTVSPGTTAGVGALRWTPGAPPTLAWRDAGDDAYGPPVAVEREGQVLALPSSSWTPVQGEDGRQLTVVVYPREAPPRETVEPVRVAIRERQCLRWTVRNVRLVDTLPVGDDPQGGLNALLVYFAQAPQGRPLAPGPFRIARVPVRYVPPATRRPDGAILGVRTDEYVSPRPR